MNATSEDEHQQPIGFQSLVEVIDTTTPIGQFFFQITGAFAEFERNLARERTLAGLASARRRGRKGGRRKAIDPKTFEMALQLYEVRKSSVQRSVLAWALRGEFAIKRAPRNIFGVLCKKAPILAGGKTKSKSCCHTRTTT